MDIGIIAGGLSLIAFGVYIYNIIFGQTRPSRSSWWIISAVWIVLLLSSLSLSPGETWIEKWNTLPANWISLVYIVASLVIAILSIKKGSGEKWEFFDYCCAVLAVISLVFYIGFHAPLLSLVTALLADFFGILPTVKNAWKYPRNEHFFAWLLEVVASILTLSLVTNWTLTQEGFAKWGSPSYLTIMNGLITLCIMRRFFYKRVQNQKS